MKSFLAWWSAFLADNYSCKTSDPRWLPMKCLESGVDQVDWFALFILREMASLRLKKNNRILKYRTQDSMFIKPL